MDFRLFVKEVSCCKDINKSSLSRIWSHMKNHDSGTITAWRDKRDCNTGEVYTKGEKKARNHVLLSNLQKQQFSVTKVKGTYIENYNTPDAKEVGEDVYLVVDINDKGNLKETLKKLGEVYEQDSILFIPKGGKTGELIGTNKCEYGFPGWNKTKILKNPIFGKSGEMMTKIKGRPFILKEDVTYIPSPSDNMGKWAMSLIDINGWESFYNQNRDIFEKDD